MGDGGVSDTAPPSGPSAADAGGAEAQGGVAPVSSYRLRIVSPEGAEVWLDGISPSESVQGIRRTLSEHPATALFTCYSLVLDGQGEVVVLADVMELAEYEPSGLQDGSTIHMVRSNYDLRSARQHVKRLRELFKQPPAAPPSAAAQPSTQEGPSGGKDEAASSGTAAAGGGDGEPVAANGVKAEAGAAAPASPAEGGSEAANGEPAPAKPPTEAEQLERQRLFLEARNRVEKQRAAVIKAVSSRMPIVDHVDPETLPSFAEIDQLQRVPSKDEDPDAKFHFAFGLSSSCGLEEFYPKVLGPAALELPDRKQPILVAAPASAEEEMTPKALPESKLASHPEDVPFVRCIRNSVWNPPPPERRLMGDLMYLQVVTLEDGEDNTFEVTATTKGWYVNGSTSQGMMDLFDDASVAPVESENSGKATGKSKKKGRSQPQPGGRHQPVFDPNPRMVKGKPMAAQELHGVLCQLSPTFKKNWVLALERATERARMHDTPVELIALAVAENQADVAIISPPWCVPDTAGAVLPPSPAHREHPGVEEELLHRRRRHGGGAEENQQGAPRREPGWKPDLHRAEEELSANLLWGMDDRGALRDWNEEYQSVHDFPARNMNEKVQRAKLVYKTWLDFQEAATQGASAIAAGHVTPINPTEPSRNHVYVFNNMFFSYAVDSKDGYKVFKGDEAAAKSARHDLRNISLIDRLQRAAVEPPSDQPEDAAEVSPPAVVPPGHRLCTLATTLVDLPCAGRRIVAQSIVPGILQSENLSKLVYGAIEHGHEYKADPDMVTLVGAVTDKFNIAPREIEAVPLKKEDGPPGPEKAAAATEEDGGTEPGPVTVCGAVEMKGIVGSDGRKYVLDVVRLSPRDANWVPERLGGTGVWEAVGGQDLPDDAFVALLRPELVHRWYTYQEQLQAKRKAASSEADAAGKAPEEVDEPDLEKLNVNVFLPFKCSTDPATAAVDEERVRKVSKFLWEKILPAITKHVRSGSLVPMDGSVLVELLHSYGVNLRYLGRLAALAKAEEDADIKEIAAGTMPGSVFPLFWRRALELEMVARASRYVLSDLLDGQDDVRRAPAAALTAFLNALLGSGGDESPSATQEPDEGAKEAGASGSAQLSKRRKKRGHHKHHRPAEAGAVLDLLGFAHGSISVSHEELWQSIRTQVYRRYWYSLEFWGAEGGAQEQAAFKTSLLRRVCQRLGLRIKAKSYNWALSKPFALGDVTDALPVAKSLGGNAPPGWSTVSLGWLAGNKTMIKDLAADPLAPLPCSNGSGFAAGGHPSSLVPCPLADVDELLTIAQLHMTTKNYAAVFQLAQEAFLFAQVVCGQTHRAVALCLSLMASALHHLREFGLAVQHQGRALATFQTISGFDSPDTVAASTQLASHHMQLGVDSLWRAARLTAASAYLYELVGGPLHPDVQTAYGKLGNFFSELSNEQHPGNGRVALLCFQDSVRRDAWQRYWYTTRAASLPNSTPAQQGVAATVPVLLAEAGTSPSSPRDQQRALELLLQAQTFHNMAILHFNTTANFKEALLHEKKAFSIYRTVLGEENKNTKQSALYLKKFTEQAVAESTKLREIQRNISNGGFAPSAEEEPRAARHSRHRGKGRAKGKR